MRSYANEYNQAQAVTGNSLPAGGYVCRMLAVSDVPEKEYLLIHFDIAEGEQAGFYTAKAAASQEGRWQGRIFKSYKPAVMGFFKGFMRAVEESNPGFTWAWDERSLVGKLIGIVMREEEFIGKDGSPCVAVKPSVFLPVEKIRSGDFTVPGRKPLDATRQPSAAPAGFTPVFDDNLPF